MSEQDEHLIEGVRIPARNESRYAGQYAGIENLQILTDKLVQAAEKAVTSRNHKVAQSNYEIAIELYHQVLSLRPDRELKSLSKQAMMQLVGRYPGLSAVNRAVALCDRANEAKRLSDQIRYLEQAKSLLEEAMAASSIGIEGLKDLRSQIVDHLDEASRRQQED
jgi:thioredoxin-like negative regulator of GroEL